MYQLHVRSKKEEKNEVLREQKQSGSSGDQSEKHQNVIGGDPCLLTWLGGRRWGRG